MKWVYYWGIAISFFFSQPWLSSISLGDVVMWALLTQTHIRNLCHFCWDGLGATDAHFRETAGKTHTHTNRGTLGLFPGGQNVNATHKDLSVPILMQSKTTQTDNRTLLGMSTERKNLFIVTFLKRQITSFLEKTQVCIWLIHHTVNFKLHFLIVNKKPEIKCDISAFVSSFVLC